MIYDMYILDKYLELIKAGIKKNEYRLYNEERRKIKIGDEIKLIANGDENNYIIVRVKNIFIYKDFNEAFKNRWENDFKDLYNNLDDLLNDCNKFYSKEEIDKYGIVVFNI